MSENVSKKEAWLLPIFVAGGAVLGWWFLRTGPVTEPKEDKPVPKMVQVEPIHPASPVVHVTAYGTVVPARELSVDTRVSGPIVRLHPGLIPGGSVAAGEELFAIDPTLPTLEVKQSEAALARVAATLEEARRKLALGVKLSEDDLIPDDELAGLETAVRIQEAEKARLEAGLERDREMLSYHTVTAPFNAIILDEDLEVGQWVDRGFGAVSLVDSDTFWVRVSLPVEKLALVRLPGGGQEGASAKIYMDMGQGEPGLREGQVLRLLGDTEDAGRLARLLVRLDHPLAARGAKSGPPFLLGSYVRVEIDAGTLTDVYEIDRASLRGGHAIWVVGSDNALRICDAEVVWNAGETLYVRAEVRPGERLITSPLRSALPGMVVSPQEAAS